MKPNNAEISVRQLSIVFFVDVVFFLNPNKTLFSSFLKSLFGKTAISEIEVATYNKTSSTSFLKRGLTWCKRKKNSSGILYVFISLIDIS